MLLTGTITMAILYIMLLCDKIVAGFFIGENGVAAVNAITPVTGVVTFASSIISIGSSILYSREIGAMNKQRANKIYGQGVFLTLTVALICMAALYLCRNVYFDTLGVSSEIRGLAEEYYRLVPVNAALSVLVAYYSQMVYTDGDETVNTISYILQIVSNIIGSVLLVRTLGMAGIILGTIIGNILGLLAVIPHYFRKSNTLHVAWHVSGKDLLEIIKFSVVDASIYLCWAVADYVLIAHVSSKYGDRGLVILALVISLIEFSVVLDGVGLAVQPLLGTYLGEKNNVMIKRLMREAAKAAFVEGLIANVIVFAFAKNFCEFFSITDDSLLNDSSHAVRIVSLGFIFCSLVALTTSYYMLVDHIGLSVVLTVIKDGLLYSFLPVLASVIFGEDAMWISFALSPLITLVIAFLFIRVRYGKDKFPFLLKPSDCEIIVLDDTLLPDNCAKLSAKVSEVVEEHGFPKSIANRAALFTEEIGLTIIEKNGKTKNPLLVEISMFFEGDSVILVERDSGVIFDITDPDLKIDGLSSFILSGIMQAQEEKAYMTTTGYNRNMMRFTK
ncbi:MAG: hypothetical protein K6E12_11325 [Saccharofermentans sp.]|nr:hypothetical protein [Saccharofermentans sp.]